MKSNDVMPVPCAAWAKKLASQPDDLTTEERAALFGHILTCPECAAIRAAYSAMDASILALPPVTPLAGLPHLYGIATEAQPGEDKRKAPTFAPHPPIVPTGRRAHTVPDTKHPRRWVRLASAVAAVLVVSVLLGGFLLLFNAHHTVVGGNAGAQTIFTASDANDGTIYALRPSDGALYWQYSTGHKLSGALVATNDTIFAGSTDGYVYALHKSDGSVRWSSLHIPGGVFPPMFTDGTALYFSSPNAIYAMRTSDGQILWHRSTPVCNTCAAVFAAVNDGTAYAYLDGLYALRASDGHVLWHHPEYPFTTRSFVALAGKVYVPVEHDGRVYELRASDGQLLRTFPFTRDEPLEMVSAGGTVYIDSAGHDLYAIRASDDSTLWHKQFSDLVFGLSAANDGTLYFASTIVAAVSQVVSGQGITPTPLISSSTASPEVDALNASDGSQHWRWHPTNNSGGTTDVLSIGDTAYLAIGNSMYALSGKDGTLLWTISERSNLKTPFTA